MKQSISDNTELSTALLQIAKLDLGLTSRYRVLVVILSVSYQYGWRPAKLGVDDLARITGLSARTVKSSLADLMDSGLVVRPSRYRSLAVILPSSVQPFPVFTQSQESAMRQALNQARKLLRSDPLDLILTEEWAGKFGLESPITLRQVEATVTPKTASLWVGAVLSLLADERVQGRPLTL